METSTAGLQGLRTPPEEVRSHPATSGLTEGPDVAPGALGGTDGLPHSVRLGKRLQIGLDGGDVGAGLFAYDIAELGGRARGQLEASNDLDGAFGQ